MALITLGANSGKGKVLQVVSATKTDLFSTTSSGNVDITGLDVDITPTSTSSKIFIIVHSGFQNSNDAANRFFLLRDSTQLSVGTSGTVNSTLTLNQGGTVSNPADTVAFNFLDNPSSTSSINYKVQVNRSGGTIYINRNSSGSNGWTSSITAMEISG